AVCVSTPSAAICRAYSSPIVDGPEFVLTVMAFRPAKAAVNVVPAGADRVRRLVPESMLKTELPAASSPAVMVAGPVPGGLTVTAPPTTLKVYVVLAAAPDRSSPSKVDGP